MFDMSYANTPEPKRILPIKRTVANWEQAIMTDEVFGRSFYAVEVGSFRFAVKYKQGDWLVAPYICAHSDFYYQVIGYALTIELRYGFPEKHKETGVVTQSQTTSAHHRAGADPIWYQFAVYRRADHEMTDEITSVKTLSVDYGGGWIPFDGPKVFESITKESPDWVKYYLENKTSTMKNQPLLPTYVPHE